jgi:predicted dehydrogenase/threonine dehydrogenase-like Zn-dependent dehydrogenase
MDAEFHGWHSLSSGPDREGCDRMKQVLQSVRTGELEVADVPAPAVLPGCVLVRIATSLVSAGTERAASDFASKNLLQKARSRPDLVREVFNKVRRDGLLSAVSAVRGRLDQRAALGYSSAGTVLEVGDGIRDLKPGDRVACAGAGFAVHAEFACIPRMLVARIPSANVNFENAAFTTLGAVAIHGVRTAEANLGETVALIGLGLLGQLTLQVLVAAGCRVIGLDLLPERAQLAAKMGTLAVTTSESEFRDLCVRHSNGHGADRVMIAAETASSGPVNLASEVARDRAIVVALGTVGMELHRKLYYEKELDFRVSRSYGPGRYDSAFEQKGRDYPIGHVRWTETRNMEAFLQLLADGKINLEPLITHRFPIAEALAAYDLISGPKTPPSLGVLIQYEPHEEIRSRRLELVTSQTASGQIRVGLLGAGTFARGVLVPAIKKDRGTQLAGICAMSGSRARSLATKFDFEFCATAEDEIYADSSINTVVIASRHHLHSRQIVGALQARKHVFCEKPLCLNEAELEEIQNAYALAGRHLMVGFNRRFAPMARRMKQFLHEAGGPFVLHYRINAGSLPADHWINDPEQGGGRILGEVCHFVDFLSFLASSTPVSVRARGVSTSGEDQGVVASLEFANGSLGTITYVCSGDRAYSKERVEVFGGGCVAVLDDFRRLDLVRHGKKQSVSSRLRQDKGHAAEWEAFSECIRNGGPAPIPFDQLVASTLATIRILDSLRSGRAERVSSNRFEPTYAPLVS